MLTIDGTFGEGGGQIVRSSLALSLLTGRGLVIENVRVKRKKPGLMRQHLTAVKAAAQIGHAVELAAEGKSGVMVSIVRDSTSPYRWSLGTASLSQVAVEAKPMPDAFISPSGMDVTPACVEYLKPLIGPLPDYVRLAGLPAAG